MRLRAAGRVRLRADPRGGELVMDGATMQARGGTGRLVLDDVRREVHLDGVEIDLSRSEFALLAALMRNPGVALSSRELLEAMWGMPWHADTSALQVHVSRLRRKLGESAGRPRWIVTVYGFGYRFEPDGPGTVPVRENPPEQESDRAEAALDGSAVLLMEIDRTIAWASDHVRRLLGWAPQDLAGTRYADLAHPDDSLGVQQAADLGAGQSLFVEERLRTSTGAYRRVGSCLRPLIDARGSVSAVLVCWKPVEVAMQQAECSAIRLKQRPSGGGAVDPYPWVAHAERPKVGDAVLTQARAAAF